MPKRSRAAAAAAAQREEEAEQGVRPAAARSAAIPPRCGADDGVRTLR